MRATFVRIGVGGAGVLLALGFLAAPAGAGSPHTDQPVAGACTPSERVQGNSSSDPDGMSNGGADKPGCPGGLDADKDGNNGCGNDADREDDNNGNCGRKPARDKTKPTSTSTSTSTSTTTTTTVDDTLREAGSGTAGVGTAVMSTGDVAASTAGVADNTGTSDASVQGDSVQGDTVTAGESQTQVLGATLERPGVLARTGAGVGGLTLLGGLLCGGGRVASLARRFLRIG
jgi:hypothetical protein